MVRLKSAVIDKPIVAIAVTFLVGFLVGWLVVGWSIWPVAYTGAATSSELSAPDKEQYLTMLADSYQLTGNAKDARDRLAGWDNGEVGTIIADLSANLRQQGRTDEALRVENLGGALGAVPTPEPGVPQSAESPSIVGRLLQVCLGLVVIILLIAVAVFFFGRRTRIGRAIERVAPDRSLPRTDDGAPALGVFEARYSLGDDNFDETFSIETAGGDFLGECGVGISETIESGPPDRVTAFEIWLFDKTGVRTLTKILMSEYAYNDPAVRDKLALKGDAVLAAPGQVISIETPKLSMDLRVTELRYGDESNYPNSYFESLGLEMRVKTGE